MQNGPLILDCDGVLYPTTQLSLRDMLTGMEKGFDAANLDWRRHQLPREQRANAYGAGVFNFVRHVALQNGLPFDNAVAHMVEGIDYSRIEQDRALAGRLSHAMETRPVMVFSNNHQAHIRNILQKRLGDTALALQIPVADVTCTRGEDGRFHGKPAPHGFQRILAENGWRAEACTFADDMPANVAIAQTLGMRAVLIQDGDLNPVLSR